MIACRDLIERGTAVRERSVLTNGVRLHVVEAGPEDGPLLILLHGFPEFWYGWHKQIEPFAAAGYRVLVPDQRGYNLSDKPRGLAAYNLDQLALDVVGLIDEAGREKAYLAAHDWGGAAAWWVGVKHPQRLERLAVLNCPHPRVLRRTLRTNPAQRKKSWYIFYYQLPWLPERTMAKGNFAFAQKALTATSRRGTFSEDDLARYREAWAQPGALTAMINWYRAALRRPPARPESSRVTVPTLLVWGVKDRFLGRELAQPSLDLCDQGQLVFLDDATHWVQHEAPERVTGLLREFFR
jgi:pimeloyl-ACP methyl ester carboxylesterase